MVDSFSAGPVANGLAFNPDGSRLYVSSRDAGQVVIYNTTTGDVVDNPRHRRNAPADGSVSGRE
jgi:sugar lactone lactonase YvrE